MDIGRGWEVESTGHPDVAPELFLAHPLYLAWGGGGGSRTPARRGSRHICCFSETGVQRHEDGEEGME